jgi:tetratricopeptide (TPR) repeat protein
LTASRAIRVFLMFGSAIVAVGCSRQVNQFNCGSAFPDARITGCTALIDAGHDSGAKLSVIYNNRGTAYLSKRDYDRAIQDFDESIRLNVSFALAYYDRGNAFDNRGIADAFKNDYNRAVQEYEEAIEDYDEAIRLKPDFAYAYFGRGRAYDDRGVNYDSTADYDHAIQDYNEAIGRSPNNGSMHTYRGFAYNHEGDYDRAIQDFNRATELNSKDALAHLGRGASYVFKGDFDSAIQDFNEAIRLHDTLAYDARGDVYLLQSNLTAATADFEKAISDAPSPRSAVSTALTLHVAMKRQGRDDSSQLAQVATAADLSQWPGPVLKLDMGKMTTSEVMAAAANPADIRKKWHICQANYFTGEDALFHNQRATALARLEAARDGCPKWDEHRIAALIELKRLGVPAEAAK